MVKHMTTKPRLTDVLPALRKAAWKPFGELFPGHAELLTNKGHVGQLLCRLVGLPLDSARCDFADGELKTNKTRPDGSPAETMWILQISGIFDTLITDPPTSFESSELYRKIRNLVFLPVVKFPRDDHSRWYFRDPVHIEATPGSPLFLALQKDYLGICATIRAQMSAGDGLLHTASGRYLQVRSKDSKPYHQIVSALLRRAVSNKNHGFYFQKLFMVEAAAGRLPTGLKSTSIGRT
jgi:DNA mismatch repair protein MutH